MLNITTQAPEFSLPDQDGREHTLAYHLKNASQTTPPTRFILLYFYPKDDTPGCTTEACTIAERYEDFQRADIKVFGVSKDSVASHKKFAEKYHLPFTLLSDERKETIGAYEAIRESGPFAGGTARVSYLIAASGTDVGKIIAVYPDVDPATHAAEILKDIEKLDC